MKNEVKYAWTQLTPMGDLYIECTEVGASRLVFGTPADARDLGTHDKVAAALDAYFDGSISSIDNIDVDLSGVTEFRREIFELLRMIPAGEVYTYGELATKAGRPKGARAVGQAVGSNPIAVIVPCHRVIASDQTLGGFSGGIDNKRFLLKLEGHDDLAGGWVTRAERQKALAAS